MRLALCLEPKVVPTTAVACSMARHQSTKAKGQLKRSTDAIIELLERMQHDNAESFDRLKPEE